MGEVYRARDTKLDREVAIKVLPAALAQDAERLARFEREAKALAALNHPNIAQIYGVEDRALVMELVPGESLKGPLPIGTALNYAKQIADALEAAHDKGIVHRDLKPANIMVTPEGVVKVLDFGLAAIPQPSAGDAPNPADSPTLTISPTRIGMILGTAAYMSPEQAAGKPVDKRADIWSFGVVLWEMLTGKRLFDSETISHTLADVLRAPIDFSCLPRETPGKVRELLKRCLDRNVKNRLQAIGEARILLEETLRGSESQEVETRAASPRHWWLWPGFAAPVAIIAAVALWAPWRGSRPAGQPLIRLSIDPPWFAVTPGLTARGASMALSPDGTHIAYTGRGADGKLRLYMRSLDQEQVAPLAGSEDSYDPFFSPDGQWIAFFTPGKLKKAALLGGGAVVLCDAPAGYGGSWGDDGNIIAALNPVGGLSRVPAGGGTVRPATELKAENKEAVHRFPQVLPGAHAVLFTAHSSQRNGFDEATIEVESLKTGERKTLLQGGYYGRYVPSGYLLYVRQGVLYAAPMDANRLVLTGPAAPVVEAVAANTSSGFAQMDFSRSGTLVYERGTPAGEILVWLDGNGHTQTLRATSAEYSGPPRFSPDGRRLAISVAESGKVAIWVYDWERDTMTRLTFTEGGYDYYPVWSPDGKHILFGSGTRGEAESLYWMRADGAGEAVRLTNSKNRQTPFSISPDGKRLAFAELSPHTNWDLWTLAIDDGGSDHPKSGKPEPFLQTVSDERWPMISHDGQWLAYGSDESGRFEVYVRRFPGPGGKWQISTGGGERPIWSKNGRELFYRSNEGMMAASYTASGAAFVAGKPRIWAGKNDLSVDYDLAPDGKRFAVVEAAMPEQAGAVQLTFLLNFFDELRRRVPTGK